MQRVDRNPAKKIGRPTGSKIKALERFDPSVLLQDSTPAPNVNGIARSLYPLGEVHTEHGLSFLRMAKPAGDTAGSAAKV